MEPIDYRDQTSLDYRDCSHPYLNSSRKTRFSNLRLHDPPTHEQAEHAAPEAPGTVELLFI
jgi:hypothetical protein